MGMNYFEHFFFTCPAFAKCKFMLLGDDKQNTKSCKIGTQEKEKKKFTSILPSFVFIKLEQMAIPCLSLASYEVV